jgi:VWFA-related protein
MRHYFSIAFGGLVICCVVAHSGTAQIRDDGAHQSEESIKVQSILVNEPVSVRNAKGQMVHNLEVGDFRITDNGVEQKIIHFELGGDAISLVVLVETSSRIDSVLRDLRRSGILLSQAVMGPKAEAAIVGFNDSVDRLQDFTARSEVIEKTMSRLQDGTSGSRLYDAMALGVEMLSGQPKPSAAQPGRRRVTLVLAADDRGSKTETGRGSTRSSVAKRDDLERRTFDSSCDIPRQG